MYIFLTLLQCYQQGHSPLQDGLTYQRACVHQTGTARQDARCRVAVTLQWLKRRVTKNKYANDTHWL